MVLVAVSVKRHRALVKGRDRGMGVDSSRPFVDTAVRKGDCRIMMCWDDVCSSVYQRTIDPVLAVF